MVDMLFGVARLCLGEMLRGRASPVSDAGHTAWPASSLNCCKIAV